MTRNNDLCTNNKKWIKTRMKTPIHINSEENEIITWYSFSVWLCLFLNSHHCCMYYCYQCSLHHISASQVNNDNVHQSLEVVYSDNDIQSTSNVAREKVGDLPLNMCSIFQNNSCNNISKCIMNYYMFTLARALKQMSI